MTRLYVSHEHDPADERLLSSVEMRRRFGDASHMFLERQLARDPTFPRPVYIARRRYWRLGEVRQWEATLSRTKSEPASAAAKARQATRAAKAASAQLVIRG